MTAPAFTILLPVVRSPELLWFAIDSVRKQTLGDFELFIVSDGAPAETVAAGHDASSQDPRIRIFEFPKGERHGEAHRHIALEQARGRYICQIADDDLWFPEHLEEMTKLLADFEFGHVLETHMFVDEGPYLALTDLAEPATRSKMEAEVFYHFGPTTAGYRIETYRSLPLGWSPAPRELPSDLFMWRKFLALPGLVAGTRFVVTSLHFPTPLRREWPIERRRQEMAHYSAIIATQAGRDGIREQALRGAAREHMARHAYMTQLEDSVRKQEMDLDGVRSSWSWRLTAPLRGVARLIGVKN